MINKTIIGVISESGLLSGILRIIKKYDLNVEILDFKDISSFQKADKQIDVLFIGPANMDVLKDALYKIKSMYFTIPVFVVQSCKDDNSDSRLELYKRGAEEIIEETEYKLAVNLIIREIIKGSSKGKTASAVKDEILHYYIDNSDSMISVINENYRYEAVNARFCERFNKNKEELIGLSPSELWGDKLFEEKIRTNLERSLNGEIVKYKASFDISGVPGKFYEVVYTPIIPEHKDTCYTIVETKNISLEEIESEKAKAREWKYFLVDKYLPMGVFECTRDGKIREVNHTFRKILGIDDNDNTVLNLRNFFPFDGRFIDYLTNCKLGEASTFSNLRSTTLSGDELYVRISSQVWQGRENEILINATLEDTTREVMLERKLNQSQRMETLGTLAGGIAHDFNTILTTITGYSELTMDEVEKDSDIYKYMTNLNIVAKRAESIINQMLVYSQQFEQQLIEVDVEVVLQEAIQFISSAIPHNIVIEQEIKKIDELVLADPTQLFRVFLNIMTNATQAMDKRGGALGVSLRYSEIEETKYIEISISDTGQGIDRAIIDRIFEPFFTTKELDKGTGMGLSVSHGIISGIDGEINVVSEIGKGSEFTIRIPVISKTEK